MQKTQKFDAIGLFLTCLLIMIIRETSVWLMSLFNHPELGSLFGLFVLLSILLVWRYFSPLPTRMIDATGKIMKDSAFAFLPVAGGSIFLLLTLGNELWGVILVMILSTLVPMWAFAFVAKKWL